MNPHYRSESFAATSTALRLPITSSVRLAAWHRPHARLSRPIWLHGSESAQPDSWWAHDTQKLKSGGDTVCRSHQLMHAIPARLASSFLETLASQSVHSSYMHECAFIEI